MPRKSAKPKMSVREAVVAKLIDALNSGTNPWIKKWQAGVSPRNVMTPDRAYKGINRLMLGMCNTSDVPFFITQGGIRKEKGNIPVEIFKTQWQVVVRYTMKFIFLKPDGKEQWAFNEKQAAEYAGKGWTLKSKFPTPTNYYKVWNVSLVEWADESTWEDHFPKAAALLNQQKKENDPIVEAQIVVDTYLRTQDIDLKMGGDKAYYSAGKDLIGMPEMNSFEKSEYWYSTMFHEMGHSTGHPKRLKRPEIETWTGFGSEPYAKEELVAEITACMVSAEVGINLDIQNSAAYLQSWSKAIAGYDPKEVFTAASKANQAVDLILS